MNRAFIMKLGWGIINDNTSLWASVFRSKYVRSSDNIPKVQAKQKDSPIWKTICKEWSLVIKGILGLLAIEKTSSSGRMSGWMALVLLLDMRLRIYLRNCSTSQWQKWFPATIGGDRMFLRTYCQ